MKSNLKNYLPLFLILLIGAALRFYNLTAISLWHDEAFSALLIKYPWHEMMYRIGLDVHPPMYYIFLRFWSYLFSDSLFALRSFSVLFSLATVWLGYIFVRYIFKNERAALWAALLLAVNPFQVQYVTEARMYTMGAFFALLAAYFLVRALREQNEYYQNVKQYIPRLTKDIHLRRTFIRDYLLFALCTAIIIYTHYYLLFTAIAIGFYGLAYHVAKYRAQFKKYGWFVVSVVLVGVAFVPWLKTFLSQFRQVGASYWIPPMDRWSIPGTVWQMLIGAGIDVNKLSIKICIAAVTLLCIYIIYRLLRKFVEPEKWLLVLNILAPFGGAILFYLLARLRGQSSSIYLDRYFLFSSTFFTVAIALWLAQIKASSLRRLLFMTLIVLNLWAIARYWYELDVRQKPGLAAAAQLLKANFQPGQKLFAGSSFEFFNLKYYLAQNHIAATPLLYTDHHYQVTDLPHFAGTAILTDADLLPDFQAATTTNDTVWLVWTNGFGGSKPTVPMNWSEQIEYTYPEVRPYVGTNIYVTEYVVN